MSFPTDQLLISADDHLDIHAMPPDVWSSALPKAWRERGPHVQATSEGPYWFCDGERVSPTLGSWEMPAAVVVVPMQLDETLSGLIFKVGMLPSEIFARQVFTTYEYETLGVELIPRIGVDNVMWASDYPHDDSTWPHSRKALAESPLSLHGAEVLRKVTCENAARVYGFRV
jgi:hypothetical protein